MAAPQAQSVEALMRTVRRTDALKFSIARDDAMVSVDTKSCPAFKEDGQASLEARFPDDTNSKTLLKLNSTIAVAQIERLLVTLSVAFGSGNAPHRSDALHALPKSLVDVLVAEGAFAKGASLLPSSLGAWERGPRRVLHHAPPFEPDLWTAARAGADALAAHSLLESATAEAGAIAEKSPTGADDLCLWILRAHFNGRGRDLVCWAPDGTVRRVIAGADRSFKLMFGGCDPACGVELVMLDPTTWTVAVLRRGAGRLDRKQTLQLPSPRPDGAGAGAVPWICVIRDPMWKKFDILLFGRRDAHNGRLFDVQAAIVTESGQEYTPIDPKKTKAIMRGRFVNAEEEEGEGDDDVVVPAVCACGSVAFAVDRAPIVEENTAWIATHGTTSAFHALGVSARRESRCGFDVRWSTFAWEAGSKTKYATKRRMRLNTTCVPLCAAFSHP